jgi:hypothetical protein
MWNETAQHVQKPAKAYPALLLDWCVLCVLVLKPALFEPSRQKSQKNVESRQ